MKDQKGIAQITIILGVIALVVMAFLIGKLSQSGSEKVVTLPDFVPTITPQSTSTPIPTLLSPTSTKVPAATIPPYTITAQLICANADEGYATDKHIDIKYETFRNRGSDDFPSAETLTDNKTGAVVILSRDAVVSPNHKSEMHWAVIDRDGNNMLFVADGREYTLKLYKLETVSQEITKDLQPIAQKTFSKTCEF